MPHKKGKRKTIPKHKKKGVKIIKNHKISIDANKTETKYPFKIPQRKDAVMPKGLKVNKQQIQQKQKRRLPVEVMPRVIDNCSESPKEEQATRTDSNDKTDIKIINLTQAKKIREQVWIHHNGKKFETKCYVIWCTNMVDVFNFQVGHDTPKALGGSNTLLNLKPICQNCNQSMGSRYSISEWNQLFAMQQRRQMSTLSNIAPLTTVALHRADDLIPGQTVKLPWSENTNTIQPEKIDLYITENDNQLQNTIQEIPLLPSTQKMNYGPLARLVSYTTNSPTVNLAKNNKNMIIQGGITALGAVIIASSWLFGY
jgi:hypothetical protein